MTEKRRGLVLGGVAAVLNAGGRAVVFLTEMSSGALGGVASAAKNVVHVPQKVAGLFGSEAKHLEEQIHAFERKIKLNYYEIGKESAHSENIESAPHKEQVQKLIAAIRSFEQEIQQRKEQIATLKSAPRKPAAAAPKKAPAEAAQAPVTAEKAALDLPQAIERAIKKGRFASASAKAIFKKVAEDLLDADLEVRMLAAAELGKIGNKAAAPVLMDAARLDDAELAAEAVNALINLGEAVAVKLFQELLAHPKHRVRMACLRGLYKLADDLVAGPALLDALRDEHAEVRRSAVTFLGWKDYADTTPSLIQSLRDEDAGVRKAAAAALANLKDENAVASLIKALADKELDVREKVLEAVKSITGEALSFDVGATQNVLDVSVAALMAWWQGRLSGTPAPAPVVEPVVETVVEPVVETVVAETTEPVAEPAPAPEASAPMAADVFAFPEPNWDETPPVVAKPVVAESAVAPAPAAPAKVKPPKEEILEMNKADLMALCDKLGIEFDHKMAKAEIRKLLLGDD